MYARERKSERGKDSGRNRQNREYGLSELRGEVQSFLEHVCKLTMSNNSWVSTKGVTVTIRIPDAPGWFSLEHTGTKTKT